MLEERESAAGLAGLVVEIAEVGFEEVDEGLRVDGVGDGEGCWR